ncbi:MAG TPA: helix-turn-helix transcriptional regulator [Pyrinomonadaceae bacterium]|nr:helix-turn-helix transcriptional regulator [Pyrinomonadaceae bacterium]
MGTKSRRKPERLAEKLRQIRLAFGLSQSEMLKRLEADEIIAYNEISKYELGLREPTLLVLLRYARLANISTDVLIDDEMDLPEKLPKRTRG